MGEVRVLWLTLYSTEDKSLRIDDMASLLMKQSMELRSYPFVKRQEQLSALIISSHLFIPLVALPLKSATDITVASRKRHNCSYIHSSLILI